MKSGAFFGWGIVIYAVTRLTWEGLVIYGFAPSLKFVVLAIVCVIAGRALRFSSWKDILPFALSWAAISAVFDALFLVLLLDWHIYADWNVWFAYVVIVIVPLLAPYTHRDHSEVPAIT